MSLVSGGSPFETFSSVALRTWSSAMGLSLMVGMRPVSEKMSPQAQKLRPLGHQFELLSGQARILRRSGAKEGLDSKVLPLKVVDVQTTNDLRGGIFDDFVCVLNKIQEAGSQSLCVSFGKRHWKREIQVVLVPMMHSMKGL